MSEAVIEAGESGAEATRWTQENLQKLLASLKDSLPENDKTKTYGQTLRAVDWDKVAFPPFSAGECQEKWKSLMKKMRRHRTLPDLLDEAEDFLSNPNPNPNPFCHKKIYPDFEKPPVPPKTAFIRKEMSRYAKKNPGVNVLSMMKTFSNKYEKLSDKKKSRYAKKYRLAFEEYSKKMRKFCKENNLRFPKKKKKKKGKSGSLEYEDEGCSKYKDLPQKPPGQGFTLFLIEQSKAGKGEESSFGGSFIRFISQRWKELSENEKQQYKKRCEEMKIEYEAKLIKYLDQFDEEEKKQIIMEKGIKMPKKTKDRHMILPGEPKMPSQSGFIYFHLDFLKKAEKAIPRKERVERAKKEWQELSEREKNGYAKIIEENMRKYTLELQAWFQTLTEEDQKDYMKKKRDKVIFLQKCIDVKSEPSDLEDEKTSTTKVSTKASRRKKKLLRVKLRRMATCLRHIIDYKSKWRILNQLVSIMDARKKTPGLLRGDAVLTFCRVADAELKFMHWEKKSKQCHTEIFGLDFDVLPTTGHEIA